MVHGPGKTGNFYPWGVSLMFPWMQTGGNDVPCVVAVPNGKAVLDQGV